MVDVLRSTMHVIKRNGQKQAVSFDKIIFRLKKLATDKKLTVLGNVSPDIVAQKVIQSMYDGITSSQLDELSARVCIAMSVEHSEYATLASRIAISNLHKNTSECFSDTIQQLYDNVDKLGHKNPLVSEELYDFVQKSKDVLNFAIEYQRDYLFDYFGFKTLERSYLLKVGYKIIERPQHMWMRVALGIHPGNIEKVLETYHLLSEFYFIHATPTLFNAGTPNQQMSSCFEENMIIGTVNRGLVKIKDVEIGDYVRTHLGNVKPVVQLHKNLLGNRALYNLKISGCSDIKVTGNHRLWTLRDNLFQWVSVENITFEDYISTGHSFQVPGAEYVVLEDVIALKVMSKTEITENKPEYVYTLGVQDDHSYNVEGIIAENCFLLGTNDSMGGIYKTISDCAQISKYAGGIGVHVSDIRGAGSYIKGTNGTADGIVKMLRVYNETARYANQGSKRNGSFAIYLEPWHSDIFEFLELKKNTGDENTKCRDLYYALWVPDAFMRAVESDSQWYLMSSDTCPGLSDAYGEEFDALYHKYVSEGNYRKEVNARDLWTNILVSQIETGMPYMLYKDHVNKKSNQKNIGTIKSSNLCAEILLYSDKDEYAVCNIATLSLPKYVEKTTGGKFTYNYQKLFEITRIVTRNLNNVIDNNFYPVPETRKSNMRHRPIAIGAQGLANTFFKMSYPFESDEAVDLNKKIFETIYYAALYESNILAKEYGSYETFQGSPTSQGILQYDMWGLNENDLSGMWNWKELKENIKKDGLRNSMLTACPPTASTSQILGNFESFEPVTSNIFMRSTLSGDFPVVNKYLIEDLQALGLWNNTMKERIMYHNGSIQNISEIPYHLKQVYKTVWECSQKNLMNMSRDRGYFTDHTQSFNLFMNNITPAKLNSAHFHGWKLGLKTSMYYCRSRSASQAQKFTVSVATQQMEELRLQEEVLACSRENPESCMMCSG